MLSRVAERIYWLGRYLERAENTARLVNVNTHLMLDLPRRVPLGWYPLIEITGSDEEFQETYSEPTERNVVRFLVAEPKNPASLLSSLQHARENARTIRDVIPREGWERINALCLSAKAELSSGLARSRRYDNLVGVISSTQQITGLLAGTMLHDFGYEFLRIGRNLERADMTTRIVDVRTGNLLNEEPAAEFAPFENIQWMSLLQSLSAYQAYRQQMQVPVRRREVLEFLFKDPQFPRAFLHSVGEVAGSIRNLPRNAVPLESVTALVSRVEKSRVTRLDNAGLHRYVDRLQLALGRLHAQITETYFVMSDLPRAKRAGQRAKRSASRKKAVPRPVASAD